jgi:hypothetical protein
MCTGSTTWFKTDAQSKRHQYRYHRSENRNYSSNKDVRQEVASKVASYPLWLDDTQQDDNNFSTDLIGLSTKSTNKLQSKIISFEETCNECSSPISLKRPHENAEVDNSNCIGSYSPQKSNSSGLRITLCCAVKEKENNVAISSNSAKECHLLLMNQLSDYSNEGLKNGNVKFHKMNPCSSKFFLEQLNENEGINFVVRKAHKISVNHTISNDEIQLQMLLSQFSNMMTTKQINVFTKINSLFDKVYTNAIVQKTPPPMLSLPKSLADVRRLYTEGVNSINKNLPIPTSKMLCHHSYVSIIDCVGDLLGHGDNSLLNFRLDQLDKEENDDVFGSKAGKDILAKLSLRISKHPMPKAYQSLSYLLCCGQMTLNQTTPSNLTVEVFG